MAMEYVGFKRGTQSELNSLLSSITTSATQERLKVGYFYLTTDTNRLYVCKENSSNQKELIDLNQSITIVQNIQSLPSSPDPIATEGQFYYLRTENVLCVYLQGVGWQQINKDTYLEEAGQNVSFSTSTNAVTVTSTVSDSAGHESKGHFTIAGSANITVEKDSNNNITISTPPGSDTQYTLGTAAGSAGAGAQITLTDNSATPTTQNITLIGDSNVSVSRDNTTGNIKITGPALDATNTPSFSAAGEFGVTPSIDGNSGTAVKITPHIKYGKTADATPVQYGTSAVFANGDANLDVYTTGQVDALIDRRMQTADAMTYKGTLASSADVLALTNVQKGDTYKASGDFKLGTRDVKLGDLLIFNAADNSTNVATSWDIIPSGDDQLIEVRTQAASNSLAIQETISGATLGSIAITGDATSHISATSTVGANNSLAVVISQLADYTAQTVAGSAANVTQQDNTNATFTAITEIQTDAYGNVVDGSIKTATFTVKDTHANISNVKIETETATTNTINIKTTVTDSDLTSRTGSFKLTSNNLTISQQTGASGNPDTVTVDLLWGSF